MAIIDDNLSVSGPYFQKFSPEDVEITTFTDTLLPYSHPSTPQSEKDALVKRLHPFSVISTMRERTPFPAELLRALPNLKLLLVTGMRHNTFDMATAKEIGLVVAAAPGHNKQTGSMTSGPNSSNKAGTTHPTTQHAWALILAAMRNVPKEDYSMKNGGWQEDFAVGTVGKTLGVMGLGRLGAGVARIAVIAFGMKVICWSTNLTQAKADEVAGELGLPIETNGQKTFKVVDKQQLFSEADVVSLHYTLSPRSRGIVGPDELNLMKQNAILVNTSRGPLIDEAALIETLERGQIRTAALDVFEVEPLPKTHPFRSFKWGTDGRSDLILSPHMGYVERETLETFYEETAENLERWLTGQEFDHRMV